MPSFNWPFRLDISKTIYFSQMISFKLLIKSSVHLLLFIAYPTIDYDQLSKKEITSVVLLSPIKRLLSPTQLHAKIDPSQLSTQPTSYTTRLPIISSPANEQFKFYLPVHVPLPFIYLTHSLIFPFSSRLPFRLISGWQVSVPSSVNVSPMETHQIPSRNKLLSTSKSKINYLPHPILTAIPSTTMGLLGQIFRLNSPPKASNPPLFTGILKTIQ